MSVPIKPFTVFPICVEPPSEIEYKVSVLNKDVSTLPSYLKFDSKTFEFIISEKGQ